LQKREAVLSIYTADESSKKSPDGYLMERTLTVSIEGVAGGGDDLDDTLDTFTQQVEAAVNADPTLGGLLTEELELVSTNSEITARGNQQVGAFRMDYECGYLTERGVDASLGPEPPTPTEVTINLRPSSAAYVPPSDGITPSTIDTDVIAPSRPPESVQSACDEGSCAIPAWTGDQP